LEDVSDEQQEEEQLLPQGYSTLELLRDDVDLPDEEWEGDIDGGPHPSEDTEEEE